MSLAPLFVVLGRIETAEPSSPIAVFKTGDPERLDAYFADTIATRKRVNDADPALIGIFDRSNDIAAVRSQMLEHCIDSEPSRRGRPVSAEAA